MERVQSSAEMLAVCPSMQSFPLTNTNCIGGVIGARGIMKVMRERGE